MWQGTVYLCGLIHLFMYLFIFWCLCICVCHFCERSRVASFRDRDRVCVLIDSFIHLYIYLCMYLFMYLCIYIFMFWCVFVCVTFVKDLLSHLSAIEYRVCVLIDELIDLYIYLCIHLCIYLLKCICVCHFGEKSRVVSPAIEYRVCVLINWLIDWLCAL